ncbi:hypothetical protein ACHAW5_011003 [Stephanodiscus triporus]|uniref:tRNA-uridine aminocarboxypropyltransferase n=1 Tax=Stephanodiscus triporus TaxID=2934178 RepID=A0ABD3MGU8_9STRA
MAVAGSGDDRAAESGSAKTPVEVYRDRFQSPRTLYPTEDIAKSTVGAQSGQQTTKRPVCQGCNFPSRTCVCPSLPPKPLHTLFRKCRILVMQHPHELRRKNRSLPLVELCMFGGSRSEGKERTEGSVEVKNKTYTPGHERDFVMKTIVGRRFGDNCDIDVMKILHDPNEVVVLVFPHKQAMGLEEGLCLAEERCGIDHNDVKKNDCQDSDSSKVIDSDASLLHKKMTLIFIDATWKHAKEMETANEDAGQWPENLIRVQMTPTSAGNCNVHVNDSTGERGGGDTERQAKHDINEGGQFIERRFHIRTPPSPDHLSTAESIAWIASRVENNPQIYESIMNALDYMVEIWRGFTTSPDKISRRGKFKMSQKKLKISQSP